MFEVERAFCKHCGAEIERGGSKALTLSKIWWDRQNDSSCRTQKQQSHEPMESLEASF